MAKAEQFNKAVDGSFWNGIENLIGQGWKMGDFEEAGIGSQLESFTDSTVEENMAYLGAMVEAGSMDAVDDIVASNAYATELQSWLFNNLPVQEDDADRTESGFYKWGDFDQCGIDYVFDAEAEGDAGVKNVLKVEASNSEVEISNENGNKVALNSVVFWETFNGRSVECPVLAKALREIWEEVSEQ